MFRKTLITGILSIACGGLFMGCGHQRTEAERARDEAREKDKAADLIERGEAMVRQGKDAQVRGAELSKNGGDPVASQTLIAEGKAKQEQGEELIRQGRKMRNR